MRFNTAASAWVLALVAAFTLGAAANAFEIQSNSADFIASPTTSIEANPTAGEANSCYPASDDFSDAGKIIAEGDWVVTSEVTFAGFDLVSYAGTATDLGGGACVFNHGKIGVYRDGAFVGLIEASDTHSPATGLILPATDGTVTIKNGNASAETGRISYDPATDKITVDAL